MAKKGPSWLAEELESFSTEGAKPKEKEATSSNTVEKPTPTERHAAAVSIYGEERKNKKRGPVKQTPDKTYSIPMHPDMWEEALRMSEAMEAKFGIKVSVRQVLAKALATGFKSEYESFFGEKYTRSSRN